MQRWLIVGLCLCATVVSSHADEFQVHVKLQEFSSPDSAPIDLDQIMANPSAFKKLKPGKILFAQDVNMSEEGLLKQTIQLGSSEISTDYRLGKEKQGSILMTVAISILEGMRVLDDIPHFKSVRSVETRIKCPIGDEVLISGDLAVNGKTLTGFTVQLTEGGLTGETG